MNNFHTRSNKLPGYCRTKNLSTECLQARRARLIVRRQPPQAYGLEGIMMIQVFISSAFVPGHRWHVRYMNARTGAERSPVE